MKKPKRGFEEKAITKKRLLAALKGNYSPALSSDVRIWV